MGRRRRLSKVLTPHLILLLFAVHQLLCAAEQDLGFRHRDRSALLQFKRAVTPDPAGLLFDWTDDSASDHCSWRGVTCDSRTMVSGVKISGVGRFGSHACYFPQTDPFRDGRCSDPEVRLGGTIPPTIGEIKGLKVLALPFHGFLGRVPREIFELEELEVVDLQGNGFSGELPSRFGPRLRVVRLGFNSFGGEIPEALSKCADLEVLDLSHNRLNGTIPSFFGKLPKLKILSLPFNQLSGSIPDGIGVGCSSLEHLELSGNFLTGGIPGSLGNCSKLQNLILFSNLLEDVMPVELGQLRKLRVLDVSRNSLSGPLPAELGNCFELSVLILSDAYSPLSYMDADGQSSEFNRFERGIPPNFTAVPNLRILWAPRASLEGMFPSDWGVCRSLEIVNLGENLLMGGMPSVLGQCRYLKYLNVSSNKLTGRLSEELHVPCMDVFDVSANQLSGPMPMFAHSQCPSSQFKAYDISSAYSSFFKNMAMMVMVPTLSGYLLDVTIVHDFSKNNFTGGFPSLPIAAGRLGERIVYALLIDGNKISGTFPGNFIDKCKLISGLILNISGNNITGVVPADINMLCGSLLVLDASGNQITGAMPPQLGLLGSLLHIDFSRNKLSGRIPASFSLLKSLRYLSLAGNNLSGVIPPSLSQLHALKVLDLSSNSFSGKIPSELLKMGNLSVLLLNNNTISGRIPPLVANNTSLSLFNVSFNNLSGPIPLGGITVRCESVIGNPRLDSCPLVSLSVPPADVRGLGGGSMSYAASPPTSFSSTGGSAGFTSIEIASIVSATAIVSVLLALIFIYIYTRKCAPRSTVQASGRREVTVFSDIGVPVTYDSVVRATRGFNTSNCIGSGGFGATYKAEIAPGVVVAVKRLSVGRIQGVQQFHAEVKTLGRWRHPNLVTLIGFHVSETEMFLIYNYLSGGNLERFIQDRCRRPVDWRMLHKIALDVARALAYLHDHCVPRILHRDVKPSNILLDNEYNAYLSDFGLARLLGNSETHATTGVAGTFGYVAPEYAMTCRVSDKADVYSYGVVLLELISDKKALDPSFSPYGNGFNIVAWAQMLLRKGQAREFFTEGLWDVGPHDDLVDTLHLGITCTDDSLSTRPTMKYVVQRLKQIQPPMCSPVTH